MWARSPSVIPALLGGVSNIALRTAAQRLAPATTGGVGLNFQETVYSRQEAESDFDAVRVWIHSAETSSASTGWTAVVASTETAASDTATNSYQPISGGSAFNSLVSSGPGWRQVTWGGSSSSGTLPASGGSPRYVSMVSDWITCPSVPRADGGLRPLILVRIQHNSAVNGTRSYITYTGSRLAQEQEFDYSRIYEFESFIGDAVGNLAQNPSGTAYRYRAAMATTWFAIEYRYRRPVISVLGIGDSITAGDWTALNVSRTDGWVAAACLGMSTPDNPITYFNGGMPSQTSATFMQEATDLFSSGIKPTFITIPSFTPNDGPATTALVDAHFARIDAFNIIRNSTSPKPKLILWKCCPRSYTGANETARLYSHSLCDTYLAQGKCDYVLDINGAVWDGAGAYLPQYAYDVTTHPNQAANQVMAALLKPLLRTGTFAPIVHKKTRIFGWANVGQTLQAVPAWISGPSATRGYQWKVNGSNVGTPNSTTYTVQVGDQGGTITITEPITNSAGNVTSISNATSAVLAAATNLLPNSGDASLDTMTGLTPTTGQADPWGGTTATLLTEDTASNSHSLASSAAISFTSGQTYTFSRWFMRGTKRYVQLALPSAQFGSNAWANFDTQEQALGTVGSAATARFTQYRFGDWYRFEITAPCTSTGSGTVITKIANSPTATRLSAYTGTSQTVYTAGGQVEQKTIAGGYVAT